MLCIKLFVPDYWNLNTWFDHNRSYWFFLLFILNLFTLGMSFDPLLQYYHDNFCDENVIVVLLEGETNLSFVNSLTFLITVQ